MSSQEKKAKLYEFAVIYVPPGEAAAVVVEPTHIVAYSEDGVRIRAARAIPNDYVGRLEHTEILVRPF